MLLEPITVLAKEVKLAVKIFTAGVFKPMLTPSILPPLKLTLLLVKLVTVRPETVEPSIAEAKELKAKNPLPCVIKASFALPSATGK